MSPATTAARNEAADGISMTHVEVQATFGGGAISNRVAVTVGAAASGDRQTSADADVTVNADAVARWAAIYDAASGGTKKFTTPLGSDGYKVASVESNVFRSPGHGYAADQKITPLSVNGQAVPAGLTEGAVLYVINPTADTYQVSATQGGAAITGITNGVAKTSKIAEYSGPAGQQFIVRINAGTTFGIQP